MRFQDINKWDSYSDQPYVITDKAIKRKTRRKAFFPMIKLGVTNLFLMPLALLRFLFPLSRYAVAPVEFFGMGVNLDKSPDVTQELIGELSVEQILIRIPLSHVDEIDAYVSFVKRFPSKTILINVLQDRKHIESHTELRKSLFEIFKAMEPYCESFQIGNAINRKKWAFFHPDEYLAFFKTAKSLRDDEFPRLKLVGPSVIDFEYYWIIRILFNFQSLRFDALSSLLYVDRRGIPEKKQMGFSLSGKIRLLYAILHLSPKCENELLITETNWPLSGTRPYAPTSENECVNEDDYASYMVRYHLLAFASGFVKTVYWHQLIAPGYGLVDNRKGIVKYKGYFAYKTMLEMLKGTTSIKLQVRKDRYECTCVKGRETLSVFWSTSSYEHCFPSPQEIVTRDGVKRICSKVLIGASPIYITKQREL